MLTLLKDLVALEGLLQRRSTLGSLQTAPWPVARVQEQHTCELASASLHEEGSPRICGAEPVREEGGSGTGHSCSRKQVPNEWFARATGQILDGTQTTSELCIYFHV